MPCIESFSWMCFFLLFSLGLQIASSLHSCRDLFVDALLLKAVWTRKIFDTDAHDVSTFLVKFAKAVMHCS